MRITIVSALVVLFISAVTSQTVPQHASLEDGCFYTDGELFGCLKTTVLSCDSSWFFQLVKPLESDPQTSYVFAEGEVYAGVEFYECYQQEDQCAFCLAFTNSQVIGNQMSTQTQIYVTCDALSQPLMYDFGELTGSGVDCGSPGYYSPPCYSFEYYDFTSTHSGPSVLEETLGYYIQAYSVWNVDEIMRVSGNCVYLKPIDCESFEYCDSELWVKLYCPDVLMDTCSQTAMLESHGGLLIVIPDISSGDFCVSVAGGHVCVNTDTIYYSYTYLSTSLELRVTNEWGYTLGALSWMMYPQFPACGFGSWECNNVFPTGSIWYEPFTWISWNSPSPSSASSKSSNHKHQSSKHHKSSNTSKSSNSSNDSDDGNAALITSLTLTGALVLLAVFLGSVYIIYRITIRARSNSSEDVYSMMLQ